MAEDICEGEAGSHWPGEMGLGCEVANARQRLGQAFCCLEACVKFPLQVFNWQGPEPSGPRAVYQNSEQKPS